MPLDLNKPSLRDVKEIEVLIVDDTKISGQHVPMGTVMKFSTASSADKLNLALLNHAGRIAESSDENKADVKARREHRDAVRKAARATATGETQASQLGRVIVQTLVELGVIKPGTAPKAPAAA